MEQNSYKTELNVQCLESGIYFIQILSEGKTYQYKFIKE
jgi:hypothetical protein